MPFIPAVNTIKAVFRQSYLGEELQNILWFTSTNPVTDLDLFAIGAALKSWWSTELISFLSIQHTLVEIRCIKQDLANDPEAVEPATVVGLDANIPLTGSVALAITFRTFYRGKSFRGRFYLGGLTTGALLSTTTQANAVESGFLANVLAAFAAMMPTYVQPSLPTYDHTVVSHFGNKAPRVTALTSVVLDYTGNLYLDSQRRRLHGRGI